ncbi:MAG: type II toxin-antitoxin system RelE/ParE family toxin [Kiloniellaceae bacterium]|nr:type II toxin-antitoxin system RelE/ParE family toxin [Kiloniellaceae bacterium]
MFTITYTTAALKTRKRLPRNLRDRITAKVEEVAADPFASHPNLKPLVAVDAFRLRVGDWRVIFELHNSGKELRVLQVMHRNEGY